MGITFKIYGQEFDAIIVNSSAGKDSQTSLRKVIEIAQDQNFPLNRITVSHQDLGKMEWKGTFELAKEQTSHYPGIHFTSTKYRTRTGERKSLLDYVESRKRWPDNKNRYCTSDFKRGPGARVITKISNNLRFQGIKRPNILYIFGFRADESTARSKKKVFELHSENKNRTVYTWLPIFNWTEKEVWDDIKASDVPYHPAYDLGMPRLSCCFCIFAPKAALMIAGKENPELLDQYVQVEKKIGHDFQNGKPIADIQTALQNNETIHKSGLTGTWNM